MLAEVYAENSAMGGEFAEICGDHADYIWSRIRDRFRLTPR